jgi:hypothetical protein
MPILQAEARDGDRMDDLHHQYPTAGHRANEYDDPTSLHSLLFLLKNVF